MWIGSYKLIKNVRMPYHTEEKLREYVQSLVDGIDLPDNCNVTVAKSLHSEACYVTIRNELTGAGFEISFRNHDNYNQSEYDRAVYLWQFKTWKKCEKFFMRKILPIALEKINKKLV